MYFGKTYYQREAERNAWLAKYKDTRERKFAWLPALLVDGKYAWLTYVYIDYGIGWDYHKINLIQRSAEIYAEQLPLVKEN